MTGGIAKVVIFSFTERGTKQNRYIYRNRLFNFSLYKVTSSAIQMAARL